MIIKFTYLGEGIGDYKKGDTLKYDTDRQPLKGDIVVALVNDELKLIRFQSTMRKKKDNFKLMGVVSI